MTPWAVAFQAPLSMGLSRGAPGGSASKQSACNAGDLGSMPGWEDPLEKGVTNPPVFSPGKSHGQRRLADYSPWGRRESDMTE